MSPLIEKQNGLDQGFPHSCSFHVTEYKAGAGLCAALRGSVTWDALPGRHNKKHSMAQGCLVESTDRLQFLPSCCPGNLQVGKSSLERGFVLGLSTSGFLESLSFLYIVFNKKEGNPPQKYAC